MIFLFKDIIKIILKNVDPQIKIYVLPKTHSMAVEKKIGYLKRCFLTILDITYI